MSSLHEPFFPSARQPTFSCAHVGRFAKSDGMNLCIIDEFYGRMFAKAPSPIQEAMEHPQLPSRSSACAVGDASVQSPTIRCGDLRPE